MTFKSWNAEFLHANETKNRMDAAGEREWDIGDLLVHVRVSGTTEGQPPQIWINVSTWTRQEGAFINYRDGRRRNGGYWDHKHNALSVLTANQLQRVAVCRQVVEDWVAGHLATLPEVAPDGAVVDVV